MKSTPKKPTKPKKEAPRAEAYKHPESNVTLRPEVGTQSQFRKRKEPTTYRYDSSLSPSMEWDGQNPAREEGERAIAAVVNAAAGMNIPDAEELTKGGIPEDAARKLEPAFEDLRRKRAAVLEAGEKLKNISRPFLNWTGKAEHLSFDVPTLPLFVHERLSTKAIIETLQGHKRDQQMEFDLFGDPQRTVTDQILRAYEYQDKWVNRMILGDSLVVMNSLLRYEGLGGQVQMIYIDPPYGVKFGSNFQPFVRKRDVRHGDDEDMTREPEVVQAYRDTWDMGLHSYLTYMRDRIKLAKDLLTTSGSVFVQISSENLHHVRELLDEIFGSQNFVTIISYATTGGFASSTLSRAGDYLIWYSKDIGLLKFRNLYDLKNSDRTSKYDQVLEFGGVRRPMTTAERKGEAELPSGAKVYRLDNLQSQGSSGDDTPFEFEGQTYRPKPGSHWKAHYPDGMNRLKQSGRIQSSRGILNYVRFFEDFPVSAINNLWHDVGGAVQSRSDPKLYAVQTGTSILQRCILMTTDPGDLVLDPTCGSGTTAYVAEQWGRRWITMDTSRVPLALARQRLLTATFPYYVLKETERGPAGGFSYARSQNNMGEEVGGIVPHITLKSIAYNEPPSEEVLVDRPEQHGRVVRVTGPFCFEATIPTPMDSDFSGVQEESYGSFVDRMTEVLRKSPVLQVGGGKTIRFKNVRPPAKSLSLSAEAYVEATAPGQKPTINDAIAEADEKNKGMLPLTQRLVALVFGPESGAVSEKLVYEAAKEANAKRYDHLYVIGFAIQPNARQLVQQCEEVMGIAATYVQATPDLMMGDLLKNMRSSQIFSVCGLPEVALTKIEEPREPIRYQAELLGMDVYDAVSMQMDHRNGDDVPAWFLDTDYNGLVFHVTQAFFPRTAAWDSLKKALKLTYDESVWDHLAGTVSAPFEAGEHKQIAVKVIDDRGNELLVVKKLEDAR